ncbi:MAG: ABC transporter permease [Acidobacteria bacterium]|nr:ABC transporter permease [Acidobacteriota bacterium]
MWNRIAAIIRKEFIQTLKDPRSLALLVGPPIIQLILFGYAVNLDVERARLGWMDADRTPESRELGDAFRNSRYFALTATPESEREIRELLDRGAVDAVVRLLPGFGRDVMRGNTAGVQILVDGTNSNTASIVSSYATQIVASYAAAVGAARPKAPPPPALGPPIPAVVSILTAEDRVWFNPDLRSRVYFVPGVIVNIIALVTIMLTAMSIVREKELGTMEQLMVTPVRPFELMMGKLLPFALIGILELAFIVIAALAVFRIPLRGSIPLLTLCSLLFLLTTLGVGLSISTLSRTQQQAMMLSFFFFMPAMLLSGFAFPIRNMPPAVQLVTYLNPLRYFMQIARDLFLKGVGAAALWREIAALGLVGLAVFVLSALRFHKKLD